MNNKHRTRQITALSLAALAGAAVMVVELGVARILTPVFGGSISVWAIVIATTMLALAAGYAFGGYRADRTGGIVVACRAAAIGSMLCALIPFVRVSVLEQTIALSTLGGAAIAAVLLIAPSLFFLSQVSPALIRGLADEGVTHVGVTAGGIYAVSTLGSLVGTLAAVWAFLYLPLVQGFVFTAVLVAIPILLLRIKPGITVLVSGGLLLGLAVYQERSTDTLRGQNTLGQDFVLIDKRNSLYGEIRIVERDERYRFMIVNGFDQGGIDLQTGESAYDFDEGLIGLGRLYAREPASVLLIGLGPGVIAQKLQEAGLRVDSVEIDAEVGRLAREYFNYAGEVIVDDGRRFLQRADRSWDMIIVDAFAGGSPPWQLYTREALSLYSEHLNPGGVVVLNLVGSHLDPAQRMALAAVVSTAREVFTTVDAYPDPWEPDEYPTRNIFIAAANQPRRIARQEGEPARADTLPEAIARSEPVRVPTGKILTDESAPLDLLVRHTTQILRNRVREYIPVKILLN